MTIPMPIPMPMTIPIPMPMPMPSKPREGGKDRTSRAFLSFAQSMSAKPRGERGAHGNRCDGCGYDDTTSSRGEPVENKKNLVVLPE